MILKPGRYINHEWNAVRKEWTEDMVKVLLCFPDIYEIGMSHVGMKILYGILNQEKDVVCERAFAPWSDMEKEMRAGDEVLSSLESKKRLNEFDIVGFSLQYEMNFLDVLNMLDLGRIKLRVSKRGDDDPIVIAGGPCVFNPEPMAEFIDAFVIGEAEEVILEIARRVKGEGWRVKGGGSKSKILKELSEIEGVYVPSVKRDTVKKRIVKNLDEAYFPTNPVVPYIQIVHDRVGIEIMRGCPHGCRFCQACKIFCPLRIRSVKRILDIAQRSVKSTGYGEISLLSLSTGDYPYLEELIAKLEERFKTLGVKISLPSLRVRSFDNDGTSIVKRKGLTFAPEAGSDRLRKSLNKKMDNEDIIQKSKLAIKAGWRKVKLYFMIGLPCETYEDLEAIIELALQIKDVNLSISPFIPKPHSEFEKEAMDDLRTLKDKKDFLYSTLKARGAKGKIKIDFHNLEMSVIEAVLSRGDRKLGGVIFRAWQKGARLQAWDEYFDYNLWEECFHECGLDPASYLKKKNKEDFLHWDFIDTNFLNLD